MDTKNGSFCGMCQKTRANYTCPKCHVGYCTVKCYQSPLHSQCSESFYKDCVKTQLALSNNNGGQEKKVMEALLKRTEEEELDSDDDQEDLNERMKGVNLEDTDQVWSRLTEDERKEFHTLVSTGQIEKCLPPQNKEAWWQQQQQKNVEKKTLVQDIDATNVIIINNPSPLVKFNILNVLYAYAYAFRYHDMNDENNFDVDETSLEFVETCLQVSDNLASNVNYETAELAVKSAAFKANAAQDLCQLVEKDVFQIVRENVHLKAALCDLKKAFDKASKTLKKKKKEKKKVEVVKKVAKKLEYYLAWADKHYQEYELCCV